MTGAAIILCTFVALMAACPPLAWLVAGAAGLYLLLIHDDVAGN